jgi:hypothetical protein
MYKPNVFDELERVYQTDDEMDELASIAIIFA